MAVMIETKDLTYTYPAPEGETNPPALRDVSVQIEKGSFTVCWATTAPASPPLPST